MNLTKFAEIAPMYYRSGTALEILSGPGVGKSSVMRQLAAAMSRVVGKPFGFCTQIVSGVDPMDIKGFLFPIKAENGALNARFSTPSIFPQEWNTEVFTDGKLDPDYRGVPECGILFIDELGQADPEVQKPLGSVLLDKRVGEYVLPGGWVVWAASNRLSDRSGVVKPLAFLQNRRKVLEIEPQYQPWEDWAVKNGIHPLAIGFAKRHAGLVFRDSVPTEPGPFCTPRSLVLCTQDLLAMRGAQHGEMRLPDDEAALETAIGWLGEGTAPQFIQFIRLANELPELEDIETAPTTTRVPEKLDARFVITMMLAHHTDRKRATPFLRYMKRLDEELQVLFLTSVSRRDPQALTSPEFAQWMRDNNKIAVSALAGTR